MTAFVLAAVLAAAPIEGGCVTTCGLRAPLETDVNTCAALQRYEDAALDAFERYVSGWERYKTCPLLKGWKVLVRLDADYQGNWVTPDGMSLLGLTELDTLTVFVGLNMWVDSSLAHELGHVIEHGLSPGKVVGDHKNWTERRICDAVNSVSRWFHNDCSNPGYSWVYRHWRGGK